MLLVVTVGSVVLGFVLSRVIIRLTARIQDVAIAVVVQFCGTFAVWMLAERLHLSGILTVVVFAMASARRAADVHPGTHPDPVVRGLGVRRVRAERARVHPRRVPAEGDPRPASTRPRSSGTPASRRRCASRRSSRGSRGCPAPRRSAAGGAVRRRTARRGVATRWACRSAPRRSSAGAACEGS